jgi:hypothetical protein
MCNFVLVKQVKWGSALFRCQYLYFCTSKASKTEYHVVRVLQSTGEAAQIELMSPFLKVRSCPFFSSCLMGLRVSYETLKPVIDTAVGVCVCARARAFFPPCSCAEEPWALLHSYAWLAIKGGCVHCWMNLGSCEEKECMTVCWI